MNSGRLLYETEGKPAVQLPLSPKYILNYTDRRKAQVSGDKENEPQRRSHLTKMAPQEKSRSSDKTSSPERRCSSRTFRYGYLVTT